MNKFGFHAPNVAPFEIEKMLSIGGVCYVVLCSPEVPFYDFVKTIREKNPNAVILLRPYWGPTNIADDPRDIALGCIDMVWECLEFTNHIVIGNEPNIETPEWRENMWLPNYWEMFNLWVLETYDVLDEMDVWRHLPALSPRVGDDKQQPILGYEYLREAAEASDVIDSHVYWGRWWEGEGHNVLWFGRRYELLHEIFPDKDIWLTECGPENISDVAKQEIPEWYANLPDYVDFAALFSWHWDVDALSYWNKDDLLAVLRDMPKDTVPIPTCAERLSACQTSLKELQVAYAGLEDDYEEFIDAWNGLVGEHMEIREAYNKLVALADRLLERACEPEFRCIWRILSGRAK